MAERTEHLEAVLLSAARPSQEQEKRFLAFLAEKYGEGTTLSLLPAVTFTVSVTSLSLPLSFAARAGMVQIISAHSSIISAANFFIVFMANLPLSSGSRFAAGFFYLLGLGLLLVLFGRFAVERRHQHR